MANALLQPNERLIAASKFLTRVKLFWKRRLDIQQSNFDQLNALLNDEDHNHTPSHDGSLEDLMAKATDLLRAEVDHQQRALNRLAAAYQTVESLYFAENLAPNPCPLIHHAQTLNTRTAELSKQKADLVRLEDEVDRATMPPYHLDPPPPIPPTPTSARFAIGRLWPRRRRASSASSEPFHNTDANYRKASIKYNIKRLETLDELENLIAATVQFKYNFLEAIANLITAFSDTQADFAQFSNKASVRLRSMDVASYDDADRCRVQLWSTISAQIGLPHQYKNFEFGGWRAPTILFACPIASEPLRDDCPAARAVHAFRVLADHTDSLDGEGESEPLLRQAAHDLETTWDPGYRDGGPRISSMLRNPGMEATNGELLIHFLRRLPEPLIPMQELDRPGSLWEPDPWRGKNLDRLTIACNRPWIGSCRRRMLVILGRLFAAINNRDPKRWWDWWNTGDRPAYWSELLTRRGDALARLLPWWLFSITLKGTVIEVENVKVNALRLI